MAKTIKRALQIITILLAITIGSLLACAFGLYFIVGKDIDKFMEGNPLPLPSTVVKAMEIDYPGYKACSSHTLFRFDNNSCTPAYQLVKAAIKIPRRSIKYALDGFLGTLYVVNNYSPESISATFLERAYFGEQEDNQIIGFTAASQHFYKKTPAELDSKEVATLFVLMRSPSYYGNPTHAEKLNQEIEKLRVAIEAKGTL